jgi:hypothetical protein
MTENPWTTPEAEAYFESEWKHALKGAEEALTQACACAELWNGLGNWLMAEPEKVAGYVGEANYKLFAELVTSMPLLAEETARAKKDIVA